MAGTWHYLREGQQVGPISQEEFYTLVQHGVIKGDTKVWCEGWSHWVSYSEYTTSQDLQNTAARAQKKGKGKGMIIGLSVGGLLLVAGAVILIVNLASGGSAGIEGTWQNVEKEELLTITDSEIQVDGKSMSYTVKSQDGDKYELSVSIEGAPQEFEITVTMKGSDEFVLKAMNEEQRFRRVKEVKSPVEKAARIKYQRRAKTTEAIDQLDKIYKGAAFYYTAPKVARTGSKLPCQFPTDSFCVPEGSPCDYPDNKYPANPEIWTTPTWAALMFQMNDSHYFKYCFDSEGTLTNAIMTASAHADLDCDGVFSTFQRLGYGDPQATRSECAIKGSAAFYVENETE